MLGGCSSSRRPRFRSLISYAGDSTDLEGSLIGRQSNYLSLPILRQQKIKAAPINSDPKALSRAEPSFPAECFMSGLSGSTSFSLPSRTGLARPACLAPGVWPAPSPEVAYWPRLLCCWSPSCRSWEKLLRVGLSGVGSMSCDAPSAMTGDLSVVEPPPHLACQSPRFDLWQHPQHLSKEALAEGQPLATSRLVPDHVL